MARQVLENGVVLPAEYSDDWYDDMTSNLTKLDDVIGSDSEKLSSADVGAAALSNNYNDLDNLPTIPTVNDATLTIQKNGVDVQTFTANASSNVTANITVPTKTSDLTNDSNFVDTSNSAVASGITSAKVTDYDSHIADTDIHVTTADKNKWNNQTYVFRYSSTALVASSTNSNTLLDNTDNLKIGDKVIDSSGVLFSITAIDTQNSTFTIGTALIDLAQDSDVVHKSGNESITGVKTITDTNLEFKSTSAEYGVSAGDSSVIFKDKNNLQTFKIYSRVFYSGVDNNLVSFFLTQKVDNTYYTSNGIQLLANTGNKNVMLRPLLANNNADGLSVSLGTSDRRWSKVYATNYYYGSNNVEFSDKFVTTDTNQTIGGSKTFTDNNMIKTSSPKVLLINTSQSGNTAPSSNTASFLRFDGGTVNNFGGIQCDFLTTSENRLTNYVKDITTAKLNSIQQRANSITAMTIFNADLLAPATNGVTALGSSSKRWSDCQTNLINGVEPSSLSLPDLDNGVDISSYITHLDKVVNSYTPSVNGWISIRVKKTSLAHTSLMIYQTGGLLSSCETTEFGISGTNLPVIANRNVEIYIIADSLESAKFYPCQGNV